MAFETPEIERDWCMVSVQKIVVRAAHNDHLVFLRQVGGAIIFPIAVGLVEAAAISHTLNGTLSARPVTHELVVNAIKTLGGAISSAVIEDLLGGVFYAKLILTGHDGVRHALDCRPSDAICLTLEAGAPLFATKEVLGNVSSATP